MLAAESCWHSWYSFHNLIHELETAQHHCREIQNLLTCQIFLDNFFCFLTNDWLYKAWEALREARCACVCLCSYPIWNLFLQNPVDPEPPCPGPSRNIMEYQITLQTLIMNFTENVTSTECTTENCSHTFEPPSNSSNYDSVSVAAENVVGVGAARTCTTQPISELLRHCGY